MQQSISQNNLPTIAFAQTDDHTQGRTYLLKCF